MVFTPDQAIDKAKWFRIMDRPAAEAVLLGSEPERPRFLVRQGLVHVVM